MLKHTLCCCFFQPKSYSTTWDWRRSKFSFRWSRLAGQSFIELPLFGAVSYLTLVVSPFCIAFAVLWAIYRTISFAWIGQDILVWLIFIYLLHFSICLSLYSSGFVLEFVIFLINNKESLWFFFHSTSWRPPLRLVEYLARPCCWMLSIFYCFPCILYLPLTCHFSTCLGSSPLFCISPRLLMIYFVMKWEG